VVAVVLVGVVVLVAVRFTTVFRQCRSIPLTMFVIVLRHGLVSVASLSCFKFVSHL